MAGAPPEYIVLEGYIQYSFYQPHREPLIKYNDGIIIHPRTEEEAIQWALDEIRENPDDDCQIRAICYIIDIRTNNLIKLNNDNYVMKYGSWCRIQERRGYIFIGHTFIKHNVFDLELKAEDIPSKQYYIHKTVLFSFPDTQVRILKERFVDPLRRQVAELQQQVALLQQRNNAPPVAINPAQNNNAPPIALLAQNPAQNNNQRPDPIAVANNGRMDPVAIAPQGGRRRKTKAMKKRGKKSRKH